MRLIDADNNNLRDAIWKVKLDTREKVNGLLDCAPTVEAIPVEWIKNYRDFMRNKEKGEWLGQFELNVAYGLDIMLGIWEKENEIS